MQGCPLIQWGLGEEESETKEALIRTGICKKGCRFQSEWEMMMFSTKHLTTKHEEWQMGQTLASKPMQLHNPSYMSSGDVRNCRSLWGRMHMTSTVMVSSQRLLAGVGYSDLLLCVSVQHLSSAEHTQVLAHGQFFQRTWQPYLHQLSGTCSFLSTWC